MAELYGRPPHHLLTPEPTNSLSRVRKEARRPTICSQPPRDPRLGDRRVPSMARNDSPPGRHPMHPQRVRALAQLRAAGRATERHAEEQHGYRAAKQRDDSPLAVRPALRGGGRRYSCFRGVAATNGDWLVSARMAVDGVGNSDR